MKVKNLKDYLEIQGIIVQPDFEEKILANAEEFYKGKCFPTYKSFDGVMKMCRFWKRYCADENEFSKLVCAKISSMVRIHAASISSNCEDDTCFIGLICKLRDDIELPSFTNTTASYKGECTIYQGFGGKIAKF